MTQSIRRSSVFTAAALFVLHIFHPLMAAPSPDVVISQIYGGGGNTGATLRNDFIELFNRGSIAVSLDGWSVQYASATGTTWSRTNLSGTIQPGRYYLVQEAAGAGGTTNLPAPDALGTIAMSATSGKVALVTSQATLACGAVCHAAASVKDYVGYGGSATDFEGAGPTSTLSNTTAAFRLNAGCTDTDENAADFTVAAPSPRNAASAVHACPGLTITDASVIEGDGGLTTASFTVSLSSTQSSDVTFDIATADGTATSGFDYQPNGVSGTIPAGSQTYAFDVTVTGDIDVEANETFFVNVTNVVGTTVLDGQGLGTIQNDDVAPLVPGVVISQVYGGGGNTGATFTHDFIELFNRAATTINLAGWSLQYASSIGTTWSVTSLTGSIPPGGYYLVQEAQGTGGTTPLPPADAAGEILLSAMNGKVALRTTTAAFSGGCPSGPTVVDFVGYGTANCFEGAGAAPAASNTTAELRKRGGCFESNNNNVDFSIGSPGPRNSATPARSCEYTQTTIHDIQGPGSMTPMLGQDVLVTDGIVTGVKTNGFFLQTSDASTDGDEATSEALFVFTSATPAVVAGDAATVRGTATEFFGLTQIESTLAGDVMTTAHDNPLPSAVTLTTAILDPRGPLDQLERFEGMRMHAGALMSVGPTNEFRETYTVLLGVARPMREPGIEASLPVPPDPTSGVVDCCIPRFDENPERILVDSDGLKGSTGVSVTSNVIFSNVTGPLDFTFGEYKIVPEITPDASPDMSAVAVPPPTGELTIGGFNIENFGNGSVQRQKAALAIRNVMRSPDIIGHVEILNLAALEALAVQVNSDAVTAGEPNPAYEARLIPAPLGGTQNVGFLVKTSRVRIDGVVQEHAAETFVNPVNQQTETLFDRPPLVLYATVDPAGLNPRSVIVVVNHLRSFIDVELVGGEGPRVRAKRTAQAESTARLLQELQTAHPATAIVSVGDYNAYEFTDGYTDPVGIIKGTPPPDDGVVVDESPAIADPPFVNLTETLPATERYSFVFEGTPQALDHVLVNRVAASYLERYAIGRANADFPEAPASIFAGVATRPERSSDHDMPVAYFCFPPVISGVSVDRSTLWPANHLMVDVTVNYSASDGCSVRTTLTVSSNETVDGAGDGSTSPDWEVVDAHHVRLRAERAGGGRDRIYVITITATDVSGRTATQAVMVTVPHDSRYRTLFQPSGYPAAKPAR